ncbi:MAG: hypothetical protein JW744_03480 [Candidatus Diapherotrites archaeon]|uniref:Class III signal peptide-containing protein n=1 Tax=Candidatus Iainarchaeum sp. TaxID=3101447 RepID=A0A939C7C2_9ARCH|nr:hypothetical protein [Candidatus Diapherotrites archaeon]
MQKGQISLEFIIAIVVALVVFGSISVVATSMIEMQKASSVRQQLDSVGNGLAAIISTSAVLDDADTALVSYSIPKIAVPGEKELQACNISIDNETGTITLSYSAGMNAVVEKAFVNPSGMAITPESATCGGILIITKS